MFRIDRSIRPDNKFFKLIPKEEHFTAKELPLILRGFVPRDVCEKFLEANKDGKWIESLSPNGPNNEAIINYAHRDTDSMPPKEIKWTGIENNYNLRVLEPYFNEYWEKNYKYRGIAGFEKPQFTRYCEGHYCNAHLDVLYGTNGVLNRSSRRLTSLLYLNDWSYDRNIEGKFSGGELCFPTVIDDYLGQCLSIQPKAGDVIVFPATPDYLHSVPVVTSGIRYTLLYFIELDK